MKKIDLTEEELQALMQCVNNGEEPAPELAKKLFPSQFTHDFKTLHDARIPTIEYAGKRPEAAILSEASVMGAACPLQLERCFDGGKINKKATQLMLIKESAVEYEAGWRNLIVQGDNLQFLKTCYLNQDPLIRDKVKGKVKLVYLDPPFATRGAFGGPGGEDSYADRVDRGEFVEQLRERLLFVRDVLSEDGTIFVHLDQKMVHLIKIVMDEVLGKARLLNEVIWHYENKLGTGGDLLDRRHDTLLWYARGTAHTFHAIHEPVKEQKMQPVTQKVEGKRIWLRDEDGKRMYRPSRETRPVGDLWNIPIINPVASERIGYPTQKPEALLERVLLLASDPGDLVMDVFAGSGTLASVAERLDRRWIVCDFGKHAVYTMQKRICLISDSQKLGLTDKKKQPYGQPPKPFAVVSVGAFDFAKIMNLRENRDAYVSFVLGIFGLAERDDSLAAKYNVSNVCALRAGNPVEIYPVWEDHYLKETRVDAHYLAGIVEQAGGKLKGDYYIIAPETCVRVGETTLPTGKGKSVTFKPLTFPYKVLEEVARNFTIEEQPSSADNINKLISSVGFYFNEEVALTVKKSKKGFTITEFHTSILDRADRRYTGLDGLAMVLIDTDYDADNGFTVDTVIYQKDIKDGEVAVKGANGKTRIIAIDRYGNESGITALEK